MSVDRVRTGNDFARVSCQSGDTRVGLIGFPSVGKSTLLTKLTGTFSEAAAYEFTTLTCIPGTLQYKGTRTLVGFVTPPFLFSKEGVPWFRRPHSSVGFAWYH